MLHSEREGNRSIKSCQLLLLSTAAELVSLTPPAHIAVHSGEPEKCKNEKLGKGRRGGNGADNKGEEMTVRNSYSCRKGQKN